MEIIKTSTKGKFFILRKVKLIWLISTKRKDDFRKPFSCENKRISRVKEIEFFVRDE